MLFFQEFRCQSTEFPHRSSARPFVLMERRISLKISTQILTSMESHIVTELSHELNLRLDLFPNLVNPLHLFRIKRFPDIKNVKSCPMLVHQAGEQSKGQILKGASEFKCAAAQRKVGLVFPVFDV